MTIPEEDRLYADDVAALLGIPVEWLKAWVMKHKVADGPQSTAFPKEWIEQGRSRADIYKQATGDDNMYSALQFWKAQRQPDSPSRGDQ